MYSGLILLSLYYFRMELLISFASGDFSKDKEQETLNLGQVQVLMDIPREKTLAAIKVLLSTSTRRSSYECRQKISTKIGNENHFR